MRAGASYGVAVISPGGEECPGGGGFPWPRGCAVKELTGGRGADMTVEATGSAKAVTQAIEMAAAGCLCLMGGSGFQGKEVCFRPRNMVWDEKIIKGLQGFSWSDYLLVLDLLQQGRIRVRPDQP